MCHALRVKYSTAEKKELRKLSGIYVPIYASIALALLAVVVFSSVPHSNEPVAVATSDVAR